MVYPIVVEVTPYMMAFLKRRREFSDLEPMETDESVIVITRNKKPRLDKLMEEMRKVTCQSYLLNDNQYETFDAYKERLFTHMEEKFNVKGKLYQCPSVEIPVIFHVNQLTSISCVVSNQPESMPIDSLITINCTKPKSENREIMHDKKEDYKIVEYDSWNIPMNHHIYIYLTDRSKETYPWNAIFENCLKALFKNDSVSHTFGIHLPNSLYINLKEFSQSIWTIFQNFLQNDKRQIYILLLVDTDIMRDKIVQPMKKISDSKSDDPTFQGISSSAANNQFTVEVIEGLITEMKVDVIVSSVDHTFDLRSGKLSNAILDKAGKRIQDECYRKQERRTFPEIALVTNGYKLPAKYVFFGVIPCNPNYGSNYGSNENISKFVGKCLEKASGIGITSIAFPALGTGNLMYEPEQVAAQMESAIAKFQANTPESSLKKIVIVIFPDGKKGRDTVSMFKDTLAKSKDSKGAIPKTRFGLSPLKYDYNALQWVQFLNYSGERKKLDQAVDHFEKYLSNPSEMSANRSDKVSQFNEENYDSLRSDYDSLPDVSTISISESEVEELLLFYDLPSEIKTNIEEQFYSNLVQNSVMVPRNYEDQFKKYLNEFRTLYHIDILHIPSGMNSYKLEDSVKKICQKYSPVKCAISSDRKQVIFRGRTFENIQAAKYQLELDLDLRENVSVSKDRFNTSETNAISSFDYKSEEVKYAQDDSIIHHKPEEEFGYPTGSSYHKSEEEFGSSTVPSYHKPKEEFGSSTVPSYHKPKEEFGSSTVSSPHKPVFKSMDSTVSSPHKPVFKSMYSTEPSDHTSEFISVSSHKKTKENSNEFENIYHRQNIISTFDFDSQNMKITQDKDCFTIEDDFIVKIYQGDILTANVDAIVNAANKYLMHGAGLARAIIKAAGDVVHREGQAKLSGNTLNDGDVLSTSAGNLKRYKNIIHAVGPMYSRTTTDEYCRRKVAETVYNSLKEANRLRLYSVALPAISSAIFAVPIDICTDGYFNGVMEFCDQKPEYSSLKEVHFVDLNQATCNAIKDRFAKNHGPVNRKSSFL